MVISVQVRRWRWPLLAAGAVVLAVVGVSFLSLPLRDSDKVEAAQGLVAWIVEGRPVPGFGEEYRGAQWMPERKRFFVICGFLPAEVPLSNDPRVQRISAQEHEAVFKKHQFDDTDYITIKLKSESESEIVLEFSNLFSSKAGHGYKFEFRRKIWGLRASGKFLWVS